VSIAELELAGRRSVRFNATKLRGLLFPIPRWIEFVEELPKTATGKIQRYRLR